jgi:hypothetical protein
VPCFIRCVKHTSDGKAAAALLRVAATGEVEPNMDKWRGDAWGVSGVPVTGRGTPNAGEVECCEPQTPAESTRNSPIISYYFSLSLHMGPPRSHRRGSKAVLPCMF